MLLQQYRLPRAPCLASQHPWVSRASACQPSLLHAGGSVTAASSTEDPFSSLPKRSAPPVLDETPRSNSKSSGSSATPPLSLSVKGRRNVRLDSVRERFRCKASGSAAAGGGGFGATTTISCSDLIPRDGGSSLDAGAAAPGAEGAATTTFCCVDFVALPRKKSCRCFWWSINDNVESLCLLIEHPRKQQPWA